jgi:ATP-dependent Lon protease
LGAPIYNIENVQRIDSVGVVNGLAWTEVGGEVLTIEAFCTSGKGNIKITGNIGKVMEESAQAAKTFVFANAKKLGVDVNMNEIDLHIHVPSGAVPKDGPSAGIAMITCILSVVTNKLIDSTVGMTGEMSFRGNVLPIGGLKEKILGGIREGLKNYYYTS